MNIKLQLCFQVAEVKRGANPRVLNQLNGKTKSASFVAFHATSMVHFIENVDEHIVETSDLRLFFQKQNVFLNQNCPTVSFVLKIENTAAAYPPPPPPPPPPPGPQVKGRRLFLEATVGSGAV